MSAGSPSAALEGRGSGAIGSAGARLRAARAAAGLSVDAVAQQLKLAPRQVTALEEDDFQRLPGRTFVRGFARNYARFLRLDPDAVLALLPAPEAAPALERPTLRTDTRPMGEIPAERETARGSAARFLWPLALLGILAIVGYYALSGSTLHAPTWLDARLGALTGRAPKNAAPTALPSPPSATPTPEAAPAAPASGTLAVAPKVLDSTPATAVAVPGAAGVPAQAGGAPTTPADASTPAAPAAADAAATTATTATTAPAAPTPAAAAPAYDSEVPLVLKFRGTSWAEVKDARGRVVLQMTGGAGMTQTVTATPPLEVALGNAPAVDVTFRGQPLDLAPYTRGNVARVGLK